MPAVRCHRAQHELREYGAMWFEASKLLRERAAQRGGFETLEHA
jgi:hypothetical protein